MKKREFVISDIHGCYRSFEHILREQIKLTKDDILYLLGDYIDRGPASKEVVDMILDLKETGYQIECIRGNHEQLFLKAFEGEKYLKRWLAYGGEASLESFGVSNIESVDLKYKHFFNSLPYYIETAKYYFVHAGFNFEIENIFEDKEAMLWARYFEADTAKLNNKTMIHGHSPIELTFIKESIESKSQVIDLDNGCVYSHILGLGNLCCFDLDNRKLYIQPNRDL